MLDTRKWTTARKKMKSRERHKANVRHNSREPDTKSAETRYFDDEGAKHFAERGCTKKRHRTRREAMNHVRLLVMHGESRKTLHPYLCRECHFFHVGNSDRPNAKTTVRGKWATTSQNRID